MPLDAVLAVVQPFLADTETGGDGGLTVPRVRDGRGQWAVINPTSMKEGLGSLGDPAKHQDCRPERIAALRHREFRSGAIRGRLRTNGAVWWCGARRQPALPVRMCRCPSRLSRPPSFASRPDPSEPEQPPPRRHRLATTPT